jgi:hypothetical protein
LQNGGKASVSYAFAGLGREDWSSDSLEKAAILGAVDRREAGIGGILNRLDLGSPIIAVLLSRK